MLLKLPAAHLGFFFLFYAFYKDGLSALRKPALWIFAILSLLPVICWYGHAYSLWTSYHNSMGVSNEDHWIGVDVLRRPKILLGLVSIELLFVFGGGGLITGLLAIRHRQSLRGVRLVLLWGAAIALYYLVILRTAGAYWAWYYHIVAVPPAALLFGSCIEFIERSKPRLRALVGGGLAACALLMVVLHGGSRSSWQRFPGLFESLFSAPLSWLSLLWLSVLSTGVVAILALLFSGPPQENWGIPPLSRIATYVIGGSIAAYFMISGQLIASTWTVFNTRSPQYSCIRCFADKISPGALIVSSGGECVDSGGHRVAGDAPQMFYWLARKGFSICEEDQSTEKLAEYGRKGAQYFIADKSAVRQQPAFEQVLRRRFSLIGECDAAWLFQLRPGSGNHTQLGANY
jgi:hypothetical protein